MQTSKQKDALCLLRICVLSTVTDSEVLWREWRMRVSRKPMWEARNKGEVNRYIVLEVPGAVLRGYFLEQARWDQDNDVCVLLM